MIKVEISNFQSIRHVSFEVDGFATILGRSNIGKSAIVRAVQAALTGAAGTDAVRHDAATCDRVLRNVKKCKCFLSVSMEMPTLKFVWKKGDGVNTYTVTRDGTTNTYEGLERGTPDFLIPEFEQVEVAGDKELIQVPNQFEPIFLLNKSGPAVADILSDVARLDQINTVIGMVNKDRKDAVAKRKVREEDILSIESDLKRYAGLDLVSTLALEQCSEKVEELDQASNKVSSYIMRMEGLEVSTAALEVATEPPLPDFDPVEKTFKVWDKASGFLTQLAEKAPILRRLTGVDDVSLPEPSYAESLKEAHLHETYIGQLASLERAVQHLEGSETLALDDEPPSVKLLTEIESFLKRGKMCADAQKVLTDQLDTVEAEMADILKALKELGVCPTCSQSLEGDIHLHLEAS